ncbi:hypothetical protein RCH09_001394 [Actimicrobium sp. GrIS 1.19]|uniref:porin PorA family protein n=1 Tax=Actimicrobium sp. GrIS 1.19 TaxID=3071708 RepID=UPI002E05DDD5|nr:hypothetical protein [Actimicrobium sp. GrIS 1.19]
MFEFPSVRKGDGAVKLRNLISILVLCLLAAAEVRWVAPLLMRVPGDYQGELEFEGQLEQRPVADGQWSRNYLIVRRIDQTLASSGDRIVVQAGLRWTDTDGNVIAESRHVYGVDRFTRMNLPEYGDVRRTGQFLFPLHTGRKTHGYWDPHSPGFRLAVFDHSETINGMETYVFNFSTTGVDQDPGVGPGRVTVRGDVAGKLWIEPASGVLTDFTAQGQKYTVDVDSGARGEEREHWRLQMTSATKTRQVQHARATRNALALLELGLPALLLVGAVIALCVGLRSRPKVTAPADLRVDWDAI